jgi:hypothetical protein
VTYKFYERTNERTLPADWAGDVLIWDIDKTYLDTHFSSLRGLVRIPMEFAVDKQAVPGSVPLIRALRRGPHEENQLTPLYFVSGSPKQMRSVIERKMLLDGVQFDGITFKDQWGLLKDRRPKAITEQVGYKLIALLSYLHELPEGARFLMFGDDTESDAAVFSLFGDVCAGMEQGALEGALEAHGVGGPERRAVMELSQDLVGIDEAHNPVEKIFIHLANRSDPLRLPEGVIGTRSFLQTAICCAALGKIRPEDIKAVARDLRRKRIPEAEIESLLEDARVRLDAPPELIEWAR